MVGSRTEDLTGGRAMRAEHRLRDGGQTADRASTPRSRAGTTRAHHPGGDLLELQASAGNRAVGRLIAALAVQRCGPNSDCDCPPEEKLASQLNTEPFRPPNCRLAIL